MKLISKHFALAAASLAFAAHTASAAFTFTDGDVVLGFQTRGTTGSNINVFFNLGSGVDLRDGNTFGTLGNIGTTLTANYGANWYTSGDVYFGAIGNLSSQSPTGFFAQPPVNGDPARTLYVSRPTTTVGGSQPYSYNANDLGFATNSYTGQEAFLISGDSLTMQADGSTILNRTTARPQEDNNSWSFWNPFTPQGNQDVAYTALNGGIQNVLNGAPGSTLIDIQRIIPTTTGANPTQPAGAGRTVSTIALSPDGSIVAIPEPSTGILALVAGLGIVLRRRRA